MSELDKPPGSQAPHQPDQVTSPPTWLALLRDFGRGVRQLLYPGLCWSCQSLLPAEEPYFCAACRKALSEDPHPTCPRCASTIGPFVAVDDGCPRCRSEPYHFDSAQRLGPYSGLLRQAILRMKHATDDTLAELMGELWADHTLARLRAVGADVVIPVPLYWMRRWRRGYNQSAALARALAGRLGLPYRPRWLRRIRHTPPQTLQSPAGRRVNVRGAFRASPFAALQGKVVLLVDDVVTTGSTASEAARALRAAGAQRIVVAALAHD